MIRLGASRMIKSVEECSISIEEVVDFGIIIFKADFSDTQTRNLLKATTGVEVPGIGKISIDEKFSIAWMSTDEYAIILKRRESDKIAKKIITKMKNKHHLCVNMSDSRRCFRLLGKGWREVLSKGIPADLNPDVFGVGAFRRTRIANVAVAIWTISNNEAFLVSSYSVGSFIFDWLKTASLKTGQVSYYR